MFATHRIGLREGLEVTVVVSTPVALPVTSHRRDRLPRVSTGNPIAGGSLSGPTDARLEAVAWPACAVPTLVVSLAPPRRKRAAANTSEPTAAPAPQHV